MRSIRAWSAAPTQSEHGSSVTTSETPLSRQRPGALREGTHLRVREGIAVGLPPIGPAPDDGPLVHRDGPDRNLSERRRLVREDEGLLHEPFVGVFHGRVMARPRGFEPLAFGFVVR